MFISNNIDHFSVTRATITLQGMMPIFLGSIQSFDLVIHLTKAKSSYKVRHMRTKHDVTRHSVYGSNEGHTSGKFKNFVAEIV